MIKKYLLGFIIALFLLSVPLVFYLLDLSTAPVIFGQEKVAYNLPYPGILPDHPLYFLKAIRDRLTDITTRDLIKKANVCLLYSDKRAAMSMMLLKKGKNKLAVATFSKGEKYFLRIPELLENSKKQGVTPSSDFIVTLKLSNEKHKELIEQLKNELPQGQAQSTDEIFKTNQNIKDKLSKL